MLCHAPVVMNITVNWLRKFLGPSAGTAEISDILPKLGFEVEEERDFSSMYSNIVTAEVVDCQQHPNADSLKVCAVSDGLETYNVVCGGANARAGIKVILSKIGAVIPNGNFTIKKSKIRGIESCGMLCSSDELLLPQLHSQLHCPEDGIVELQQDVQIGIPIAEALNMEDVMVDVSITPNRGDAASALGLARDISAGGIGDFSFSYPEINLNLQQECRIVIEAKDACHAFLGVKITGIKRAAKVSDEITALLACIGKSYPLPLVALSNYIMFDIGHPNHFFDADKIDGGVTIRYSTPGENFIALGGEEYTLPANLLVIADESKVISLAGVMGGELSKVDENTTNLLLEIANFSPHVISRAVRALNLHSESSFRFERRIDGENLKNAMAYTVALVQNHFGGTITAASVVKGSQPNYPSQVTVSYGTLERIFHRQLDRGLVQAILLKLGFEHLHDDTFKIPSWRRGDVENTNDIAEELARIRHDLIHPPEANVHNPTLNTFIDPEALILKHRNMLEVMNYSFVSEKEGEIFSFTDPIFLSNPISSEMSVMRQSLAPGLLAAVEKNIARGYKSISFFERGNVYFNTKDRMQQTHVLAGVRYGAREAKEHYSSRHEMFDFFDIKADFLSVISNKDALTFVQSSELKYMHPKRCSMVFIGRKCIGYCGQIHPKVLKNTFLFEIYMDEISSKATKQTKSAFMAKSAFVAHNYQPVSRDFCFIVDSHKPAGDIIKAVKKAERNLLASVKVFDVYEGDTIPSGKKSVALTVKLQPKTKTLIEEEINAICEKIISSCKLIGCELKGM